MIKWDKPCYKCLSHFCDLSCKEPKHLQAPQRKEPEQEPVKLRRGDILRCIETDELCTVWFTSTTGKTRVKWSANNFGDYTKEQIGELFWLETEPDDLELAAEKSDNYAAFHAGYRFAVAHHLAQPEQKPVAWIYESVCGNDFSTRNYPPSYAKNIRPLYTTPSQPEQDQDEVDIRSRLYQRIHELETQLAQPEDKKCGNCGEFGECCQDAQPEQEPVAWLKVGGMKAMPALEKEAWLSTGRQFDQEIVEEYNIPLYTHPPQRKPLTDEQILAANYPDGEENGPTIAAPDFELICFARQIEAANGIKE